MGTDILRSGRPRPVTAADRTSRTAEAAGTQARDRTAGDRRAVVATLYQAHALGLVRLAHVMLGDAAAAEDVVQEAFCGLYKRWALLSDQGKALQYARSAVLNGCRSVLRQRARHGQAPAWSQAAGKLPDAPSAEEATLAGEEQQALLVALQRLPHRQREAVVLRYYLDMPTAEIAATMGISPGSARATTSRALESLGRLLEESR
jgi:RNA polymerase sigma-70 factor (sigma-E family)